MSRDKSRRHWPAWAGPFLVAYAKRGIMKDACDLVGIDRTTPHKYAKKHDDFREAWDQARQDAYDVIEQELYERAMIGWDEPVFQGGMEVGTIRKRSDRLLELLIKAVRPDKFRERRTYTLEMTPEEKARRAFDAMREMDSLDEEAPAQESGS